MSAQPRYGNQDLWLLRSFHAEFRDRLVDRSDSEVAFPRQIDLWWFALGIGVTADRRMSLPDGSQLIKFNDGGILEADPWRITHLELLALAEEGQQAATNAATVVRMANEYALAGCTLLAEGLRDVVDTQNHLLALVTELAD